MKLNKINIIFIILNICLLEALILFAFLNKNMDTQLMKRHSNGVLTLAAEDQNINMEEQELKRDYNIIDE